MCLVSRLPQDMVFHVSLVAQSPHLYVLSSRLSKYRLYNLNLSEDIALNKNL